jgi:hypothetical protein
MEATAGFPARELKFVLVMTTLFISMSAVAQGLRPGLFFAQRGPFPLNNIFATARVPYHIPVER